MKVLRPLPKSWVPKVTTVLEDEDLKVLVLDHLLGSLTTHEIIMSKDLSEKKKGMTFKASTESEQELDHEETILLTRKFQRFFKKIQI